MPIQVNKDGTGQITLSDWRGGLNLLDNPLSPAFPENMTPTATNVWASGDLLEKRPSRQWGPFNHMGYTASTVGTAPSFWGGIFGPENNFYGAGAVTSSGIGGILRIQTVASGGQEYLFFSQSCYTTGMAPIVVLGRLSTSTFPFPGNKGTQADAILTLTSSGAASAIQTIATASAAAANAFLDSTLIATGPYSYMLSNAVVQVTSTAAGTKWDAPFCMAVPITLLTSGSCSYPSKTNIVLAAGTTNVGIGSLVPNLSPGGSRPKPPIVLQLSDNAGMATGHYYVNFTYPPAYKTASVTGGLIQFSPTTASGTQVSLNAMPGVIVTGAPLILNDPVIFNNYIFAISSANPNNIVWSALASGDVWPPNNVLTIGQGGTDTCVSLVPFAGNLVIIKHRTIWLLSGNIFDPSNPTYTLQQVDTPADFVFEYPNGYVIYTPPFVQNSASLWYTSSQLKIWAHNGIYTYFGGLKCDKLYEDKLIEPLVVSAKDVGQYDDYLNTFYGDTGVTGGGVSLGAFNSNLLINYVKQNQGRPRVQLIKDFRGAWWGWNTILTGSLTHEINLGSYAIFQNSLFSAEPIVYSNLATAIINYYSSAGGTYSTAVITSTATAYVQHFMTATSDMIVDGGFYVTSALGTPNPTNFYSLAISADYKTKIFDIGHGHFHKVYLYYMKQNNALGAKGNLTLKWWIDGANSASASFDQTVGSAAAGGLIKNFADVNQVGHSIQYQIIQNDVDTNFQLARLEQKFRLIPDEEIT